MRDKLKSEQYFYEYIQEETERLNRFAAKLENHEIKENRIYSVKNRMNSIKFGLLAAKYSCGEDISKLEKDFLPILEDMPLYWNNNSSYVDMLWMMSLAVLFDVNKDQFCILSGLVDQYGRNDALLDFFTKYKTQNIIEDINGKFSYGYPYDKLAGIITDKGNGIERLREYLEKHWYRGHTSMAWYNVHKAGEKSYSGYWSYESGAIVKITGWDDSSLKDVPYYPYDLVHYEKNPH